MKIYDRMTDGEIAWVALQFASGRKQADIAAELNLNPPTVCQWIKHFCDDWSGYDVTHDGVRAYGNDRRWYVCKALENFPGEIERPEVYREKSGFNQSSFTEHDLIEARREHAWLLRAEGYTNREIGEALGGISRQRTSQILLRFSRRMQWAMRRTRFTVGETA